MKAVLVAGLCGVLFALGLGLGGMTQPEKVLAFLDVAGQWDPSLAMVMMGAVGTHAVLLRLIRRRPAPVLASRFPAPAQTRVDMALVAGAALFGVGWGLVGYCPGPAFTSLATGGRDVLLFVGSMLAGMVLFSAGSRAKR
ncbi:YeeE/YedE family protein [Corallococcus sp. ZKHCc1 1396]|uniref:YeeE/YedE family protein n=1 Tax=Corallococcus soli TaxID=2710757 RepID=A0ABR9PPQ1_9BACT|nr:YeeE/YedE family protein [Corallococcus soli]